MRSRIRSTPVDINERYNLPEKFGPGGNANLAPPVVTGVTVLRFPPQQYPIPDARGFTLFDQVDTVGVNQLLTPAGLVIAMPVGYTGVVRSITIDVNDIAATTDLRYSLRIGGTPVPGYDSLRHFPRVAASVSRDFDAYIVIPDGRTLDVLVTNVDGGAHKVGGSITGWSWPTTSGKRWIGEA